MNLVLSKSRLATEVASLQEANNSMDVIAVLF